MPCPNQDGLRVGENLTNCPEKCSEPWCGILRMSQLSLLQLYRRLSITFWRDRARASEMAVELTSASDTKT